MTFLGSIKPRRRTPLQHAQRTAWKGAWEALPRTVAAAQSMYFDCAVAELRSWFLALDTYEYYQRMDHFTKALSRSDLM